MSALDFSVPRTIVDLSQDTEYRRTFAVDDVEYFVQLVARADLPTRYGKFTILGFFDSRQGKEHTALVNGEVQDAEDCPVRVHSQCHTGDVLGSLRCDCRDQLEASLSFIGEQQRGVLIYLKQEGRGIGLLNKIKAYHLQDMGYDTVEANEHLGFPAEGRDYFVPALIIEILGLRSVALMTNNPAKAEHLQRLGVAITRRIPVIIPPNEHSRRYLDTKRLRMGHVYDDAPFGEPIG